MGELIAVALAFLLGALNARRVDIWCDRAGWWLRRRIQKRLEPRGESVWVTPEGAGWLELGITQLLRDDAIGSDTHGRIRRNTNHIMAELKAIQARADDHD